MSEPVGTVRRSPKWGSIAVRRNGSGRCWQVVQVNCAPAGFDCTDSEVSEWPIIYRPDESTIQAINLLTQLIGISLRGELDRDRLELAAKRLVDSGWRKGDPA